ncbi:MAG: hypothetical protein AAGA19_04860 [Pseudomonadota bacterium]
MRILITSVTAAIVALSTPAALADFRSERSATGSNGIGVTTQRATITTAQASTTTVNRTNNNGQSSSRVIERSFDPATRTWSRSVTGTTRDGQTWTNNETVQCNNGACTRNGVYVGPRGRESTVQGSANRVAPGQWNSTTTRVGPDGTARTVKRTWRRIRSDN